MGTRAKKKRRSQGKAWAREYQGKNLLHAYRREFGIPLIAAINDLESIGVPLNTAEVAQIKIDRHHNGQQQVSRKTLAELSRIICETSHEQ